MADVPLPGRDSVEAQREMFRLAAKQCGLTISAIAARSPLHESTMKGWRDGAAMPAWALGALGEAGVPDRLLSMILEPFARHVGTNQDSPDLDAIAEPAGDYAHEYQRARHPHSPGGVAIVPQEAAVLHDIRRRMVGEARA